jgi:F5/8 type C domain
MTRRFMLLTLASIFATGFAFAQEKPKVNPKEPPKVKTDNKNGLIKKYRDKLELAASTTYPGWGCEKAIDGNLETSWFSNTDDSVAKGKKPWFEVKFPEDVAISRVTVLGNREPSWLKGYTILAGGLELLDKDGKRIHYEDNEGIGNFFDFDFKYDKPKGKVRTVRFKILGDQGDENPYGDIAIAEIQID